MSQFLARIFIISIYIAPVLGWGQAVLVEEPGRPITRQVLKRADDSLGFRNMRKVGVGLAAGGAHGLVGIDLELNFSPETSLRAGFGIADNYQSFGLAIKRVVGGKWFAPYVAGGFTRWYTVVDGGPTTHTTTSFLAERFLSETEKRTGQFAETLIYPALGIQYLQLNGNWAGSSLYAEILMLLDIDDFNSAATGALGFLYYF